MTVTIQKPSLGRVVIYTDNGGVEHSARMSRITELAAKGVIDLHVDIWDFLVPVKPLGNVRHSLTPKPHTWRYPPFVEGKIEVPE